MNHPDNGSSSTPAWTNHVGSMHMIHPQNVLNASDGPILNFTFHTPASGSRQESEAVIVPLTARADHEIYYHQLSTQKRGSPLWVPGPGMQLPIEYRRLGTSIGDVGIITSTGTFDFLFNIFLPANHPINIGNVPQTFSPLSREQIEREIQKTCDYGPDSYVTSPTARRTALRKTTAGGSWLRSTSHQIFESTSGEAAILAMPDGASTQNLLDTLQIHRCISENARNWYEYAMNERGRAVNNGDIRVVIGVDKVKSWGIATSMCNAGQTASLTFKQKKFLNHTRYCWDCIGGSGRVGPAEVEISELVQNTTTPPENQSVFIRTMNFTLSGEIWYDFPSQAAVQSGPLSDQGNPVSANRERSEGGPTQASEEAFSRSQGMQGTSHTSVIVDPLQHGIDYHPSAGLHTYLHEKFPRANIVITQDSDWMSVLDDNDSGFPQPEEVIERILKFFNPTEHDGIVTVCKEPYWDSPHFVSTCRDSTGLGPSSLARQCNTQTHAEIAILRRSHWVTPPVFSPGDRMVGFPLNTKIDNWLREERKILNRRQKGIKILLLGQSESGKSAVLKNFQLAFVPKQFDKERTAWKIIVHLNVIRTLKTILDALDEECDSQRIGDDEDGQSTLQYFQMLHLRLSPLFLVESNILKLLAPGRHDLLIHAGYDWKAMLNSKIKLSKGSNDFRQEFDTTTVLMAQQQDIITLWRNPKIQEILVRRRSLLRRSSGFFMDDIERVIRPDFVPTDSDVIRARLRTIGINEQHLELQQDTFSSDYYIIDVAGARSQRQSWIPYFDDVQCILFLAPLAFNETLEEDCKINKLEDSLQLWKEICRNKLLAKIGIILFLNKKDILKDTLAGGVKVKKFVPLYGDRPNDVQSVTGFFKEEFRYTHKKVSPTPRPFICHETSAIDIRSMGALLHCVKDTMARNLLKQHDLI